MPTPEELKSQARTKVRAILANSESFRNMSKDQQFAFYKDLVNSTYQELVQQNQPVKNEPAKSMSVSIDNPSVQTSSNQNARQAEFVSAMATPPNTNPENVKEAGNNLSNLVRTVDFPKFVKDLVTGVFDANIQANKQQMENYTQMLKDVAKTDKEYAKDVISEKETFRAIAQTQKDRYSFFDDDDDFGEPQLIDNKTGQAVDRNDNSVQKLIADTKLGLVKEHRQMLMQTLLMGVSRLVVEKGTIRAEVEFSVSASATTNQTTNDNQTASTDASVNATISGRYGLVKGNASTNLSRKSSRISIATSDATTDNQVKGTLKGFVEIQFKSDYFKLDNFRETFDLGKGQLPQGANAQQNQASAAAPES